MFLCKALCLCVFNLTCLLSDTFDGFADGLDNACSSCLYDCLYISFKANKKHLRVKVKWLESIWISQKSCFTYFSNQMVVQSIKPTSKQQRCPLPRGSKLPSHTSGRCLERPQEEMAVTWATVLVCFLLLLFTAALSRGSQTHFLMRDGSF